jgi:hypothetical protein
MNDKKFLAQLNLYLDGEIDPAGAAELEHEILSNPARRRIYTDYCRIHRATKLAYDQFRLAGAEGDASAATDLRPSHTPVPATGLFAAGGRSGGRATARPFRTALRISTAVAAACAAFVVASKVTFAPAEAPDQGAAPAPVASVPENHPAVATESVKAPEATFPAPFASEFRADPYVVQVPHVRPDPFALTTWSAENDLGHLMPTTLGPTPTLKVDPRFRPAAQGFELPTDETAPADARSLRLRLESHSDTKTTPTEFSVRQ